MKNPHGVEPTRFLKREESDCAIGCFSYYKEYEGPIFGNRHREKNDIYTNIIDINDIYIGDLCNEERQCYIHNDGTGGYECHPQYKKSLFVGTAGPDEKNYFSVLDYEVYTIDYESKYTIDHICNYPDIIWEYIETLDISEESLKQFEDESKLLNDLNTIHCEDSDILVKISNYYFTNPSEFLPNTQLVKRQYDTILREWLGNDYKWKLLYRSSEHEYTAESFHEYCDDTGPTLIVIKSNRGWIFGGYTTESWGGDGIFVDMIY